MQRITYITSYCKHYFWQILVTRYWANYSKSSTVVWLWIECLVWAALQRYYASSADCCRMLCRCDIERLEWHLGDWLTDGWWGKSWAELWLWMQFYMSNTWYSALTYYATHQQLISSCGTYCTYGSSHSVKLYKHHRPLVFFHSVLPCVVASLHLLPVVSETCCLHFFFQIFRCHGYTSFFIHLCVHCGHKNVAINFCQ